jgi:hypothetical protein
MSGSSFKMELGLVLMQLTFAIFLSLFFKPSSSRVVGEIISFIGESGK